MTCEHGGRRVPVSLDLSFAQPKETRSFRIRLARATLTVDLITNSFGLTELGGTLARSGRFPDFQRNDLFVAELRDFLGAVRERRPPKVSLADGVAALDTALRIKVQLGVAA
jgi:predicted dehydrogenase